jgi:carnitine 3-dehydrogenase
MVEGTLRQAAGRSIRELERLRDDYLVAIQQVLRQYNIGAGATLRSLEERLYREAAAAHVAQSIEPGKPLRLLDTVVRPEWVDYNRHMSDFRYTEVFGDAMDALFRRAGVDETYRETGRMYYSVENHVRHVGQAKAGEPLYVTTQLLGVDDKRVHVFHRMHRGRDDKQIATAEQMYLHVDTVAAKAAPADAKIRAKLESIRGGHAGLPLPPEAGRPVGRAQG